MADGLVLNPGAAGATLWTDDLGAAGHVQGIKILDATDGGTNRAIVTAGGALKVDNSAVNQPVIGPAAHDAAVSGNPIRISGYASTAAPTNVSTDGDTVNLWADLAGRLQIGDGGGNISIDDGGNSITIDGSITTVTTLTTITNVVHVDDNAGSLTVDNGGTFAVQATIASGATAIAKAEDVASANADVGVPAMAVQKATPANTAGTDGDYEFLQISAGRLWASATIDAALPAGTNAIGKLAANSGVDIGDIDVTSVLPGTAATNLGKAEDAAHTSGDVGVMSLAVRSDAGGSLSGTDGDYSPLQVDGNGALRVTGGGGGTEYTEDAAAAADPVGHTVIVVRKDTPATTVTTDGDNIALRGSNYGAAYVTLIDNGGNFLSVGGGTQYTEDAAAAADPVGNALIMVRKDTLAGITTTDGDNVAARGTDKGELYVKHVDHILVDAGTNLNTSALALEAGNLATIAGAVRAEDVASADAHTGIVAMAVRKATPANTSGTDGDYEMLQVSGGRLWVDPSGVTLTVASHAVTNAGTFAVQVDGAALTSLQLADDVVFAEDAGHTTGDKGDFVLGVRNDTPNTALTSADADYGAIALYRTGAIRTAIPEEDFAALGSNHVKKYYTNAGAVTDGIVWSPAAGKRWYVTDIFVNTSAAATITLEDDLAAGDSAVWKAELAANSGWSHSYHTPLFSGEDAADLMVTTSAGNVYISITGYEI